MKECAPILRAEGDQNDISLMRSAFQEAGATNRLIVVRNGQKAISYLKETRKT